jgi:hypothetical protein
MLKLIETKTYSPAITKSLLLANIKTKRTPMSLSRCLNSLAVSLSGLPGVPCIFLMMNTSELWLLDVKDRWAPATVDRNPRALIRG